MFFFQHLINVIESNFVLVTGLIAVLRWIWEYSLSRKFEKNKFLLERMEKFFELESTKQVHKLLDWNSITIEIGEQSQVINDDILNQSLITHDRKNSFSPNEIHIRYIFDEYFDNLGKLIILSETGLVDKKNLKKFLKYWILILNGQSKNKPKVLITTIHTYLEFYGYDNVLKFIK